MTKVEYAGRLLNDEAIASMDAFAVSTLELFRSTQPVRPLTRRERWAARRLEYRDRIVTAVQVLRGDHDCGYY